MFLIKYFYIWNIKYFKRISFADIAEPHLNVWLQAQLLTIACNTPHTGRKHRGFHEQFGIVCINTELLNSTVVSASLTVLNV